MVPEPTTYDIAELASIAGVSSRTIRYYGELDLLKASSRGPGGRRRFGTDAAERLRFISRLKTLGMSLEEIGELNRSFDLGATPAMLKHLDSLLEVRLQEVTDRIRDMRDLEFDLQTYRNRIRGKSNPESGDLAS
ncbi:MAG: MerR family transcriptional regulator [Planctomycetota bacterium]|nr:MerR family transcriptional regulator [Planctomycetota bacterium]MDA1114253.1 MerR family transcriptional regulator [Planctomycetota bacterium]